jgi:hypothetical protein
VPSYPSDRNLHHGAVLQELESPMKATNTTGIYLEHIGAPLEIQMRNGTTALQGTTFRDRLLPPTVVVPPVPTTSKRIRKGGATASVMSSSIARPPLSIGTTTVAGSSRGIPATLDDEDVLQSARSTGSSSIGASSGASWIATPTANMPQLRRVGEESATAIGGGGDGFASIDHFFHRMRQDLRDFRRVDTAEMGRQHLADVAMRMAAAASNGGRDGAAGRSSSAQLSPWIRVDPRRRSNTNEIFQSLQHTALTDITRPDVKRYLQNRERKYHENVQLIYEPAKLLLEAVWDQHRVPKKERAAFIEMYFDGVGDILSYDAISRELERYYQTVSDVDVELMRQVSLREAHIAELKHTISHPPPSLANFGNTSGSTRQAEERAGSSYRGTSSSTLRTTSSSTHDTPPTSNNESAFVMSVLNCICLLRYNTCMIVDLVQKKRGGLDIDQRSSTMRPSKESSELANNIRDAKSRRRSNAQARSPTPGPKAQTQPPGSSSTTITTVPAAEGHFRLMWEGSNYLITMQHDLDFLQHTALQKILDPAHYRLVGNPFILPNALLNVCEVRNDSVKHHQMPLALAATTRGILRALRSGGNCVPSSGRDDDDGLSSVGTRSLHNGSATNHSRSATPAALLTSGSPGQPPPRPSTSMSQNSSVSSGPRGVPGRKSPHPLNGRIVTLREGEEVTVTSAAVDLEESALSASGMSRDKFFAKLKKDELMRSQRIPMDRSNVYQYPTAVYHTAAASPWVSLAHRLRRSLDPRVPSKPYDDVAEFERLQFGRLTVPPSNAHPYNDPMVDKALDCIRSVLSEVPSWTHDELMRRDILIFGEETVMLKATAHAKLHRGLTRFRMAYRGFVASMQTRRLVAASGGDENAAAQGFVDWVQKFAPSWMNEVTTVLLENDADGDQSGRRIAQAMKERFFK